MSESQGVTQKTVNQLSHLELFRVLFHLKISPTKFFDAHSVDIFSQDPITVIWF
jgi:hypothetical protein